MPTFFGRRYMRKELKHPFEVYVGIFVLLLTAGICTALAIHSRMEGPPLFEIDPAYLQRSATQQLAAAALPTLDLPEWSEARDVRAFSPDTLYEKINGRADLYLQYNFKQLTFAKYIKDNDPDQDIQVWLYDMDQPENARGIYQAELSDEVDPVDIGTAGYRSGASIFFWKGPMYVSILTIESSLAEGCEVLARKVAETIEDQASDMWAESVLPQENRIEASVEYLASDAFGLAFLNQVYTARYAIDGSEDRALLFAHRALDDPAAEALLAEYIAFFNDNGRILSREDGIVVGDGAGVIDAVFQHGRYLVGVSDASDADVAAELANAYRSHLQAMEDRLP